MKNIMKAFLGVLVITLVMATLSACDLSAFIPSVPIVPPTGCEHTGGEATCTDAAVCELCGESYGEAIGHSEIAIEGKLPTCSENGLTEGKKCSVCGEVLVEQNEIPANGHTEEIIAGKDATCTETGLTEGKKCSVCGEILVAQEEISSLGHKDENSDFVCDICEAELCTDHVGGEPVKEGLVEATCQKEGSYDSVIKCSVCGDEISRTKVTIEKLAHTEEVLAGKDATCTATGLTEGKKCSVCGETLVAQKEIPMAAHTEEIMSGKDATCTATGLTEGKKCSVCGEILVAQQTIDYLSHIAGEWIVTCPATCTEDGERLAQCQVCESIVKHEVIPAGHKIVDGACTECGLILNVLVGKGLIPASDAAGNIYSASYGYGKINDGNLASRYSSKQKGGKVEAIIDLGAIYDLYEFKVLLYDYNKSAFNQFGTGMEIQVLFGGEWKTIVNATAEDFKVVVTGDQNWLTFDLGGANAKQVKFIIPEHGSSGWSTFWEIECSAKVSTAVEPEPEEPVFVENVFAGKQFTPTADALASVLNKSWWKGGGYETLTDGIKNADNAPGRFSTAMALTGMMDSTIDLGGSYELHSFKFYTYDPAAGTTAGSVGADLLIQVYADGEWKDIVTCTDNAAIMSHLVVNDGTYNDYLEFDLGGVVAEKVRFYISASASANGTTYEEVECSGYEK